MMKLNLIFYFFTSCLLFDFLNANVEHKDEYIDLYLANISGSMDEKTQLLEHILKNPNGYFVDIGTGGDAVSIIVRQLPRNSQATIIAADIDPMVIESIKKRSPEICSFLNNRKGPRVELLAMSATKMQPLGDNSITGIGASALAHEIFSYIPSNDSLGQFVSEVCRVLEKDGMLIYRDPKWVDDPGKPCVMTIQSELCRYYTTLFLTKFLDREHSLIKNYRGECCKPNLYSIHDVELKIFFKNSNEGRWLNFSEFSKTPCWNIDYSKNIAVRAPQGLIAEIQRHYLMYLRDYHAIGLLDSSQLNAATINLDDLRKDQLESILSYSQRVGLDLGKNQIDANQLSVFNRELEVLRKIFSEKCDMGAKSRIGVRTMINSLPRTWINKELFHVIGENGVIIDPKILALLFRGGDIKLFSYLNQENIPFDLLEHLKLEGEEHYFYKTTDELITYLGQYSQFLLKDGPKHGYCLAPLDEKYIKEAERPLYRSILERDLVTTDLHGNIIPPVTKKSIIHFQLQPQRKAFATYKKILGKEPNKYPELKEWISVGTHEMLDLVSDDDVVIGVLPRSEVYEKKLNNFRVINVFLINSKGELWIPTRTFSKTLFPGSLDCSVGGHVLSNETYFEAFCRQTKEETNIDCENYPHRLLAKLNPKEHGTSAFMEVYAIEYTGPVPFNTDNFVSGQWISPKNLKGLLDSDIPMKEDLSIIFERCFPDV